MLSINLRKKLTELINLPLGNMQQILSTFAKEIRYKLSAMESH